MLIQLDKAPYEVLHALSFVGRRTFNDLYTDDMSGFTGNAIYAAMRKLERGKLITIDRSGDEPVMKITTDGQRELYRAMDRIKRDD